MPRRLYRVGLGVALVGLAAVPAAWLARADRSRDGEPLTDGALASIQQGIAAREYRASESGGELQAPNRAQNLRTYFGPAGIRVHDRTAPGSPHLVSLELRTVRRGAASRRVEPGKVVAGDARIEIARSGLVEWYENGPDGLEQGFALEERFSPDLPGELLLELAVSGASVSARGEALVLATATGRKLAYGKLHAQDASGRVLAARLEAPAPDRIVLALQDAGAAYPVVIDPLLGSTVDAVLEADQGNALMGWSVASAGDVNGDGFGDVIVGAPFFDAGEEDEGAAFVFLGSVDGIADGNPASAHAQLESNQANALLGHSVASAGDVNGDGYSDVIVAARQYTAGENQEGAAFVFLGSATGIADGDPGSAHAQLESDQELAAMGHSVASAGDVNGDGYADVIVGAVFYDAGESNEGAAFVFLGSATGIADGNPDSAHAQLESDQAGGNLGESVASAGDVNSDGYSDVIVGSSFYDAGQTNEGAAFVFLGSPGGIVGTDPDSAHVQLELDQANAGSSLHVASAGDVNGDNCADVIVGAQQYDAGQTNEGAAFVFLGAPGGMADGNPVSAHAQLEANEATAFMGASVASAGDVNGDGYADVIVGANAFDATADRQGAAFVFVGSASGIADGNPASAYARIASDHAPVDTGFSVASAGDVNGDGYSDVIVGSPVYSDGQQGEGAALVFLGSGSGIAAGNQGSAFGQLESDQAAASLGYSVASAGDVNGDGYADVIVGAPFYDAGVSDEGAAFLFLGSQTGIGDGNPLSANAQLEGDQFEAQMGRGVASAGDVNGDGYADVIVGANLYDAGQPSEGAAFIFLGSVTGIPDGNPDSAHAQLESDQAGAALGKSVASAGDVNGDGYADVIVGAEDYDAGQNNEGAAFVFLGSPAGIADGNPGTAHARFESNQDSARLGYSVASAGDVNGDGYADVLTGVQLYDGGDSDEGAALVFLGSASGIASGDPLSAHALLEGNQASAWLGASVAPAGDVNRDGYGDVLAAASRYDAGQADEGAAFVFLGSASGIASGGPASAHAQFESNQISAWLGESVAAAGDVNGDGFADVIVGVAQYDGSGATVVPDVGLALVFLGSASGMADGNPATAHARLDSTQASARLGISVASAGDVNSDGFADVIVGAYQYNAALNDEGAAFVFLGNSGRRGRRVLAEQLVPSGNRPVQPFGSGQSGDSLTVRMRANDPAGTLGLVKLQVEACPPAAVFGSVLCTTATTPSWQALAIFPVDLSLSLVVPGLAPNTLYRWRARVLRVPRRVVLPGVTPPPSPAHGPWRRPGAQIVEADLRTIFQLDTDSDGIPDATDNCPFYSFPSQVDTDLDGRGNVCECTDQNGDGQNTVSDLLAINQAIFNPALVTPLCDGNNDEQCNVSDIVAANIEIFSATNTSTCARQPVPGP